MHIERSAPEPTEPDDNQKYVWYDGRNRKLAATFADLNQLNAMPEMRNKKLIPAGILAVLAGLAVTFGYSIFGLVLCAAGLYLTVRPFMQQSKEVKRQQEARLDLNARLESGEFGWEFMRESDPLWVELARVLKEQYNIDLLRDIMQDEQLDKAVTPVLSALLFSTSETRAKLRKQWDQADLTYLRTTVTSAAHVLCDTIETARSK